MRYVDFIESQYYNPSTSVKGWYSVTEDIYAICYATQVIVQANEIRIKRDIGGENHLLVCVYCLYQNYEIPCSGGRVSTKQKKAQAQQTKRKILDKQIASGRRKGRKN